MPNKTLRALAASLISISAAALLTACGGGSDGPPKEIASASTAGQSLSSEIAFAPTGDQVGIWPVEIAFAPIEGQFGVWPVQSYVARTESQWSQMWEMHAPAHARPRVDFSVNTVVGVSLGQGPNGCSKLEIPRVTEEVDEMRVEYRVADVPPDAMCTQALVPLRAFIAIPATSKPIIFQRAGSGAPDGLSREIAFASIEGHFGVWPVQSYVARTDSQWRQMWEMHAPAQTRPRVDFSANTVAGVSLAGAHSCSRVEIPRVIEEPEQIRVDYRWADVPPDTLCAAVIVPLTAFIKIPATAKPVIFQRTGW